jgi:Sec-independent protein translocase protein TatA
MFGHWFEILAVLFIGLLVFGPKRMIEMGSQVGKMVRELRESTRNLNFSALLSTDESPKPPTYSYQAPVTTPTGVAASPSYGETTPADELIVDGGVERIERAEDLAN